MKVGILGSGEVGQALGRGFASRGHDVKIASRNPKSEALVMWQKQTKGKASTGTFEETAKHGEILVLASLGRAVEEVLRLAGPPNMAGKVVMDTTNACDGSPLGPRRPAARPLGPRLPGRPRLRGPAGRGTPRELASRPPSVFRSDTQRVHLK